MTVAQVVRKVDTLTMSLRAAGMRLGLADWQAARVAYYGGMPVERNGRHWKVSLDPAWKDGTDLYDAYVAGIVEWDDETSYAHRRIRVAARVPHDHPWPDGLDDFALASQGVVGLTRTELRAYFVTRRDAPDEHVDRLTGRLLQSFEQRRTKRHRVGCDIRVMLLRHPDLALPGTCVTDDEMEKPPPEWLGSAMGCGHVSELACAAQIVAAEGKGARHRRIGRGFEFVATKLVDMAVDGPPTPEVLVRALHGVLDDAIRLKSVARARVEGVRAVLAVLRGLSIYLMGHPDQLGRIAPLLSRAVHRDALLRTRLRRLEKSVRVKSMENRKKEAEEVTNRFGEFRRTVAARALEAKACGAQIAEARSKAEEHFERFDAGERDDPYYEVFVALPVFDDDSRPLPEARQLACWRVWREGDLWRSIDPRQDMCPSWCGLDQEDRRALAITAQVHQGLATAVSSHGNGTDLIMEFVECLPDVGGRTSELHLVKPYRLGLVTAPLESPPQLQRERTAYVLENKLPHAPGSMPLGGHGLDGISIARWARQTGRCVVPLDEAVMGTRFAHCFVDIVADSLARRMEVLQIVQTADCIRHDLGASANLPGFKAVPRRRTSEEGFVLSATTCSSLLQLARDVAIATGHEDGWLRDVPGEISLPERLARRAPFVFQWGGRALGAATVGYLVALLSAGFGKVSFHILRHAASNNMRRRGVHAAAVQAMLNHQSSMLSDYYSAPTEFQVQQDLARAEKEQQLLVREIAARERRVAGNKVEKKREETMR
jgi:hypothetical protein